MPLRNKSGVVISKFCSVFLQFHKWQCRQIIIIVDATGSYVVVGSILFFLAYANDVNILGGSIHTLKKNAEALVAATREIGLDVK